MGTFSHLAPVVTDVAGLAAGVVPVALGSTASAAWWVSSSAADSRMLGTVVFAAATPLNARVFLLAGPAPPLADVPSPSAGCDAEGS